MVIVGIVIAIVVGIIGLIWLIHRLRTKHEDALQGPAPCPKCGVDLVESGSWSRRGLRGDYFHCTVCGTASWWNMSTTPPKLVG